jgi:hypothetical protein
MNGRPVLEPSCVTGAGEAAPGVRFAHFLGQFPNRNTFVSICNEDLSDALIQVAQLLARIIGNPCLDGKVDATDLAPDKPGIQIDCAVSDTRYPNTPMQEATPLRRCDMMADGSTPIFAGGDTPCWYVVEDLTNCADTFSHLVLTIMRNSDPPTGTHVIARCTIDPDQ